MCKFCNSGEKLLNSNLVRMLRSWCFMTCMKSIFLEDFKPATFSKKTHENEKILQFFSREMSFCGLPKLCSGVVECLFTQTTSETHLRSKSINGEANNQQRCHYTYCTATRIEKCCISYEGVRQQIDAYCAEKQTST